MAMEIKLSEVFSRLWLAPPKMVKKNPASKAKNPHMVPVRDWAAEKTNQKQLREALGPYLRRVETQLDSHYYQPKKIAVEHYIKISDLYDHLPAEMAALKEPTGFQQDQWEALLDEAIDQGLNKALHLANVAEQHCKTTQELKRKADEDVAALEALGERIFKRPRH